MNAAGKSEWIGSEDARTVQIAVELGADVARLAMFRQSLRTEIQASSLCNESEFAERFLKTLENYVAART
tara:strand:+ start:55 stop:264 length:210 start_codon:yes stop_codon:yes gene_type:complete